MSRVLFVCKQNAGRSQMSDALFQLAAQGRHESRSAGTRPAEHVHPVVAEALRELGIDLSGNRPQMLTDDLAQWADLVVTMGCGDECPYIPDLLDPADLPIEQVRLVRDDIEARVADLVRELDVRPAPKKALSAN